MELLNNLLNKIRRVFERKAVYVSLSFPVVIKIEKSFNPLDNLLPIEKKYGNRMVKHRER